MQKYILDKGFGYKAFMFISFSLLALVMYQGHIKNGSIYSILFFGSLALCAFQVASIFYVLFVKRLIEIRINEDEISWKISDNNKVHKTQVINRSEIKEVKTEVNYLTGNIYSNFTVTFVLKDNNEIVLTDGLIYDFGLKKAEDVCRFLLENNLGNEQDIKFAQLIKQMNIDLNKEQKFTKKDGKAYYTGVISKNKKEFLSLRLQIESLYSDYKDVKKNANNEYLVESHDIKDSFIYLRSNAIGLFVEFYNVSKKDDLKTLKEMGHRKKIGFS